MYPKLEINLNGIIENALKMQGICNANGVNLSVVTKCLVSDRKIVQALSDSGIKSICESRIENLKDYKDIAVEKWLIREPMLCEAEDVVRYSDVSLNSEKVTLLKLNEEAEKQNKTHNVILMYELGDLREGADKKELESLVSLCLELKNIHLAGIGVNLSCYGSIMPDKDNMQELSMVAEDIENKFGIRLSVVSGGNSTSYEMLREGLLPSHITSLRMGEAVFLGNVPCIEKPIEGFSQDNFILKAQIVELKEKPSVPRGTMGLSNSFGEAPMEFEDKGVRKRAIIAIGKQDINVGGLSPIDNDIEILDGSSDYVILDVTDSKNNYNVGDEVSFKVNYSVLLGATE